MRVIYQEDDTSTTSTTPKLTAFQKISNWLNFAAEEEEHIATKVPFLNTGKGGEILSVVFLGTELAEQVTQELSQFQAAQQAGAATPPAAPAIS